MTKLLLNKGSLGCYWFKSNSSLCFEYECVANQGEIMGKGRELDKFEKVQAENSKRAKKNYEKKLKRLRYKEEQKRLENKKKAKK